MIAIQNIYYMLSYAFQILNEQGYKDVATEDFDNTAELCASILSRGISVQIKRGMLHEYIDHTECTSSLRGKIEISESVKQRTMQKKQMVCTFDEFSVNAYMNKVIKSTATLLIKSDISFARKKELKKLMVYFRDVEEMDVRHINWNVIYNRNSQSYRMLVSICYLVVKGLLQTQSDGSTKLMDFLDEQRMYHLYEKFLLEYFRREFPQISANASQIPWQLDDDENEFLPVMQSDIMIHYQDHTLIIDAKYYSHTMQTQYDKQTLHSGNMYQIFTYVKNECERQQVDPQKISGMLLYAKTDESITPDNEYRMSGNRIAVRTLDLNQNFTEIKEQLNGMAEKYLGARFIPREADKQSCKVNSSQESSEVDMREEYDIENLNPKKNTYSNHARKSQTNIG